MVIRRVSFRSDTYQQGACQIGIGWTWSVTSRERPAKAARFCRRAAICPAVAPALCRGPLVYAGDARDRDR